MNHGGPRAGAGRPPLGRTRRVYYLTDLEEQKTREFVKTMRRAIGAEPIAEHPTSKRMIPPSCHHTGKGE